MAVNLESKTLLGNWVEERQCASLEEGSRKPDGTLSNFVHINGHKGLLTADAHKALTETSTIQDSYKEPQKVDIRTTGSRKTQLEKQLYDIVSAEVKEEFLPKPLPMDYTTTFKGDFTKDFDPRVIPPTREELLGYNNNIGYRQMWMILQQKHGLQVKRSTVQMLMSVLDSDGAKRRRCHRLIRRVYQNKGPDFVWHLDGYDKLKQYGFAIHGCIDGYSRKVIWLKLSTTNNDPNVVLLFYLLAVLQHKGCPSIVRSDCGTENTALATSHMALRHQHADEFRGEKSFRFGSSTTNTRIESWWAQLRNSVTDWWINEIKDLVQDGLFNPNNDMHRHCLAFIYAPFLQKALDDFRDRWNSHRMRPNKKAGCPTGVPDDLYNLPHLTGTRSYCKPLDYKIWSHCYLEYAYQAPPFYPEVFSTLATQILAQSNILRNDITISSARAVYMHLSSTITALL